MNKKFLYSSTAVLLAFLSKNSVVQADEIVVDDTQPSVVTTEVSVVTEVLNESSVTEAPIEVPTIGQQSETIIVPTVEENLSTVADDTNLVLPSEPVAGEETVPQEIEVQVTDPVVPSEEVSISNGEANQETELSLDDITDKVQDDSTKTIMQESKFESKNQTTTVRPQASAATINTADYINAHEAVEQGKTQVGTYSEVTKQVVSNISIEEPVVTQTGYTIVGTQDSQVIIQISSGETRTVEATTVGATVNADRTLSVKTETGEEVTLPSTGETPSLFFTFFGLLLILFGAKKRKNNLEFV